MIATNYLLSIKYQLLMIVYHQYISLVYVYFVGFQNPLRFNSALLREINLGKLSLIMYINLH